MSVSLLLFVVWSDTYLFIDRLGGLCETIPFAASCGRIVNRYLCASWRISIFSVLAALMDVVNTIVLRFVAVAIDHKQAQTSPSHNVHG